MVTSPVRRQIRGFALVWISITIVMALATFLAIYFTYNPAELRMQPGNPLPLRSPSPVAEVVVPALVLPSPSPQPTFTPTVFVPSPTPPFREDDVDLVATPTVAPSPTRLPTPLPVDDPAFQIGIHVQQARDDSAEGLAAHHNVVAQDLRLPWVKHRVAWKRIEPAPDDYDWTELDLVVGSAARHNLKLLLTIDSAPDWAREEGVDLSRSGPPADPQAYARFVAQVVTRYQGKLQAIEVWQEQNLDRSWTSAQGLSAANYLALLQATWQTVKMIDRGLIVISGALAPTGVNDGVAAHDDISYMRQLIDGGLLQWADCVGAHHTGYNVSPDYRYNEIPPDASAHFRGPFKAESEHPSFSFRSTLEGYANRIRAEGSARRICVTEFGWATDEDLGGAPQGFEFALDNTLEEQAEWTARALTAMEEWGWVWLAFIWNYNYGPFADYATTNENVHYSLIGPGGVYRPAFYRIRDWQRDYAARAQG